jgi:hypothetical protein
LSIDVLIIFGLPLGLSRNMRKVQMCNVMIDLPGVLAEYFGMRLKSI